ncbi:MAG TPA: PQQ-binding-like beta-propeller repeat protein [Pirellulales bacterium]|jgi:outer membrane protein assembly factor BamB|nr:PQQ-binding-like beta-propeller repeat protein [Pirellulales bacterium]
MFRSRVGPWMTAIAVASTAIVMPGSARAQTGGELVAESAANQYGLHRAWYTRAQASVGIGRIESIVYHDNTLFVQTRAATLQAIDAETGRTLWIAHVGKAEYETMSAGADKDFVAVTNGEKLYVLRRATGDLVWQTRLGGPPNAGCAVGGGYTFVPLIDGKVEAYLLRRTNAAEAAAILHFGVGAARAAPLVARKHVYWSTEAGDLYVDAIDTPMARNRFRAGGPILSTPTVWSPRVFVTSQDGSCYALKDDGSMVLWQFSAGAPVRNMAVPMNDVVYVVSDTGTLFQIAASNGEGHWALNGVAQVLAASATRLYVADIFGQLLVLDAKTGARLGALPAKALPIRVTNLTTDRVFLASEAGTIICLHEQQQTSPLAHTPPIEDKKKPAKKTGEAAPGAEPAGQTPPGEAAPNPFGM